MTTEDKLVRLYDIRDQLHPLTLVLNVKVGRFGLMKENVRN
jgi:hypothetical protein